MLEEVADWIDRHVVLFVVLGVVGIGLLGFELHKDVVRQGQLIHRINVQQGEQNRLAAEIAAIEVRTGENRQHVIHVLCAALDGKLPRTRQIDCTVLSAEAQRAAEPVPVPVK